MGELMGSSPESEKLWKFDGDADVDAVVEAMTKGDQSLPFLYIYIYLYLLYLFDPISIVYLFYSISIVSLYTILSR